MKKIIVSAVALLVVSTAAFAAAPRFVGQFYWNSLVESPITTCERNAGITAYPGDASASGHWVKCYK